VYFRGYTNHEEWTRVGNNFGLDTDSTSFSRNEALERRLSEDRAFGLYSYAVNEPSIALNPESARYTGTAGENNKVVRVYLVPSGISTADLARLLDSIENLETDISSLKELVTETRDRASDAASYSREARDASLRAEEWSKRTYGFVKDSLNITVNWPRWFVSLGVHASSKFGQGLNISIGREFLDQNLDVYVQASFEEKSHSEDLLWRPALDPTPHWGAYATGALVVRPYLKSFSDHARLFLETGFGAAHVAYSGPPTTSIGWHHTALLILPRAGVQLRSSRFSAEVIAGEEIYIFTQSSVLPSVADGDLHVSAQVSFQLTFHF